MRTSKSEKYNPVGDFFPFLENDNTSSKITQWYHLLGPAFPNHTDMLASSFLLLFSCIKNLSGSYKLMCKILQTAFGYKNHSYFSVKTGIQQVINTCCWLRREKGKEGKKEEGRRKERKKEEGGRGNGRLAQYVAACCQTWPGPWSPPPSGLLLLNLPDGP